MSLGNKERGFWISCQQELLSRMEAELGPRGRALQEAAERWPPRLRKRL